MANTKDFGSLDRGSIPLRATEFCFFIKYSFKSCLLWFVKIVGEFAPLAQWIEQKISNLWVIGLNPIGSTH